MTAASPSRPGFTYLVLAHQHPDEVVRLAEAVHLRDPDGQVALAWNGPLAPADAEAIAEAGVTRVGSGRPALWGSYDVLERILEALADVHRERWVAVVSGDSHPTGDLVAWQDDVVGRGLDVVGHGQRVTDDRMLRARVDYRWVQWPKPSGGVGLLAYRAVGRAASLFGPRRRLRATSRTIAVGLRRRKDPPAVLGHGDAWFALAPAARRRLLELAERPEVLDLYRPTHIPDEHMVQTVAITEGWRGLGTPLMFTVWPYADAPHPRALGPDDLELLVGAEEPFARKVSGPDGVELARLLDERFLRSRTS